MYLEKDPTQKLPFTLSFDIAESEVVRDVFKVRVSGLVESGQGDKITETDVDLAHWQEEKGPIIVQAEHPRRVTEVYL